MTRLKPVHKFILCEDGAVTTDWVPLVGATVGLGLAVTGVVSGGVESLAGSIRDTLNSDIIAGTSGGEPLRFPNVLDLLELLLPNT